MTAMKKSLTTYAEVNNHPILIACDSNCHSTLFEPRQNSRGDQFDDWISATYRYIIIVIPPLIKDTTQKVASRLLYQGI